VSADLQLPALASLGGLKDAKPVIIVDTREQNPLQFSRLESRPGTLLSGDYSIGGLEGLFAVERKSVADLAACCMGENRARFERELHRFRGYRFKRLLIVGTELEIQQGVAFSRISPKAIWGTLWAFEARFDTPVVFRHTPELAARQIETWPTISRGNAWQPSTVCVVCGGIWRKTPSLMQVLL
jgi:DNA excision repair protein ERCC-4